MTPPSIILLDQFRTDEFDDPISRLEIAKEKLYKIFDSHADSFLKTLWLSHWYMDMELVGVKLEELCKKAKHHNVQLLKPRRANKDNLQLSLNFISLQEFLQSIRSERFEIDRDEIFHRRDEIFHRFQHLFNHSLTRVSLDVWRSRSTMDRAPLDVWRSTMDRRPGGINFPGTDKRTQTAALRQAKFYLLILLPQCGCRSRQDFLNITYSFESLFLGF